MKCLPNFPKAACVAGLHLFLFRVHHDCGCISVFCFQVDAAWSLETLLLRLLLFVSM